MTLLERALSLLEPLQAVDDFVALLLAPSEERLRDFVSNLPKYAPGGEAPKPLLPEAVKVFGVSEPLAPWVAAGISFLLPIPGPQKIKPQLIRYIRHPAALRLDAWDIPLQGDLPEQLHLVEKVSVDGREIKTVPIPEGVGPIWGSTEPLTIRRTQQAYALTTPDKIVGILDAQRGLLFTDLWSYARSLMPEYSDRIPLVLDELVNIDGLQPWVATQLLPKIWPGKFTDTNIIDAYEVARYAIRASAEVGLPTDVATRLAYHVSDDVLDVLGAAVAKQRAAVFEAALDDPKGTLLGLTLLRGYAGQAYSTINHWLRHYARTGEPYSQEALGYLRILANPTTQRLFLDVSRDLGFPKLWRTTDIVHFAKHGIGVGVTRDVRVADGGFISTTINPWLGWIGDVTLEITPTPGVRGLFVPAIRSSYLHEAEVVLWPQTVFRLEDWVQKDKWQAVAKALPPGAPYDYLLALGLLVGGAYELVAGAAGRTGTPTGD